MKKIKIAYKTQLNNFALDVEFEIPDQGISVLFGPSGSGKSSVLNHVSGLDDQSIIKNAKLELNDVVYDDSENNIKLNPWQRKIAYVFQDNRLFPNMTLQHNPEQLSGGQKQRVSMVRALLSNPELLIMDEPLAALDHQSREELLPYIECIHKELTIPIIYVSHDIKEVLRLADYIVVMDQGKVVDKGELSDLCISQPLLTQAEGASFILQGEVEKVFVDEKLLKINCEKQSLFITGQGVKSGDALRILIHAKDVSLCLSPPQDSSILNCIPVIVSSIKDKLNGKYEISAKLDEQLIVAMISYRSAKTLELEKGKTVFAQFKATAMIK